MSQMSERHCPTCGISITADQRFCTNCGTVLEAQSPPPSQYGAPPPSQSYPYPQQTPPYAQQPQQVQPYATAAGTFLCAISPATGTTLWDNSSPNSKALSPKRLALWACFSSCVASAGADMLDIDHNASAVAVVDVSCYLSCCSFAWGYRLYTMPVKIL